MKTIIFILSLFLTNALKSQIPVEAFTDALQSKQYASFEKTFHKASEKDSLIDLGNTLSRVIVGNYKEVYYQLFDKYPLEGNTHYLKMIVKGNDIIYYHFSFVNVERQGKNNIFTTVPIDTFINLSKFNAFKSSFKSVYEADLKETDLWRFHIVRQSYGLRSKTENLTDYDKITELVNNNQRDSLLLWLQSANVEKQLYGLWGYHLLIQKQVTPSPLELRLIKTIIAKKTKVYVWGYGCEIEYITPREFVKRYNLKELPN
jgi:hypothetical protein